MKVWMVVLIGLVLGGCTPNFSTPNMVKSKDLYGTTRAKYTLCARGDTYCVDVVAPLDFADVGDIVIIEAVKQK